MVAALLLLLAFWVAACAGERTFEPTEFVDEANAEGAALVLGDELTSTQEGVDVFALAFEGEEAADGPAPASADEDAEQAGGSLMVADDAEQATAEFERCEGAVTLTCYRAANVVVYFDAEPTDEHVARVDAAVRALGSE